MDEERNITSSRERLWNDVVQFINSDYPKLRVRIKDMNVEKVEKQLERKFFLLDIPLSIKRDVSSITLTKEGR